MRAALLIGLVIGCAPPQITLISTPPPGVDRVAGLALGEGGALLGATGLVPADSVASMLISAEDEAIRSLMLVGYSDAELTKTAGGSLPDGATLARLPLLSTGPQDPILPPPRWSAEGTMPASRIVSLTTGGTAPDLHADWVPSCPPLIDPRRQPLLAPCDGAYCGHATEQLDCSLALELERCVPGAPASLDVGARGQLSGSSAAIACSPAEPGEGAAFSFTCGECRIDALQPPFTVPFVVSAPITITEAPDPEARLSEFVIATSGYILDLISVGAPSCEGRPKLIALTRRNTKMCAESPELVRIDAESGAIEARRAIAGGCPRALLAEPSEDRILVLFDHPLAVARFDCALEPVDVTPIAALEGPDTVISGAAMIPGATGAARRIGLGLTDPNLDARIAELEVASTAIIRVTPTTDWQHINSMTAFGLEGLAIGQLRSSVSAFDAVRVMDLSVDPPTSTFTQAKFDSLPSDSVDALLVFGSPPLLAYSSAGRYQSSSSALRIGEPGAMIDKVARDYTTPKSGPSALHFWSAPPTLPETLGHLLVATTEERTELPPVAWLGLVDGNSGRYLPGRIPIGYGPAKTMADGIDGEIWVALAWQGAIVRVRPSDPRPVPP